MPAPVTFVSHELVHFRAYRRWVDLKYFAIKTDIPDRSLLAHLIKHEQYRDHYAGQDAAEQPDHRLHGPYRLEAITPAVFEPVSTQAASEELQGWAGSWGTADEDGAPAEATLAAGVLPKLGGESIFRLPDLRESAEHEWGWVVGHTGFHELVVIDRAASMLTLLVASDD